MAPVTAPFLYVAELLHDPIGLSTRFLCAANGYLHAERTAKSLPLQAAELWLRSFCPGQRAPGLEPLASNLKIKNTTAIKCYVPSWSEYTQLHSPSVKTSLPVTKDVWNPLHDWALKTVEGHSASFAGCKLQLLDHRQPIPIVAAFSCTEATKKGKPMSPAPCFGNAAFWAAHLCQCVMQCARIVACFRNAAGHLDILKCSLYAKLQKWKHIQHTRKHATYMSHTQHSKKV